MKQNKKEQHSTATTTKEKSEKSEAKEKKKKDKKKSNDHKRHDEEWTQVNLSQIMHELYECRPLFIASDCWSVPSLISTCCRRSGRSGSLGMQSEARSGKRPLIRYGGGDEVYLRCR
jgi:hypothetical protein